MNSAPSQIDPLAAGRVLGVRDLGQNGLGARPNGPLVWFWCQSSKQAAAARVIAQQMADDGEQVDFLITVTVGPVSQNADNDLIFAPAPASKKAALRAFLDHWRPDLLIWMQGSLDAAVLAETDSREIPRILVNADGSPPLRSFGAWVPGRSGRILNGFTTAIACDEKAAAGLRKYGMDGDRIAVLGRLDEGVPVLDYNEAERQEVSKSIGTRPLWLAVDCSLAELGLVATAHKQAIRRAHRLLLVLVPRVPASAPEIQQRLTEMNLTSGVRSAGDDPDEEQQVYIADLPGELGLWYRLAPVCYLGGTLIEEQSRHPFEAAALGSAIIHGTLTAPHGAAFERLDRTGGARPIATADELSAAVETLLSPDKAAQLANAAWAATSEGAEATNRLVSLIQSSLDTLGG